MRMSQKCHNNNHSDNSLTSRRTDGGKSWIPYYYVCSMKGRHCDGVNWKDGVTRPTQGEESTQVRLLFSQFVLLRIDCSKLGSNLICLLYNEQSNMIIYGNVNLNSVLTQCSFCGQWVTVLKSCGCLSVVWHFHNQTHQFMVIVFIRTRYPCSHL